MGSQQTSRSTIVMHRITGFLASVFGYLIDFIFGITLLFGKLQDTATVIILLVFLAIGTLLIVYGFKTKRKIKRFKKYVSLISLENQTSLNDIATSCSQSVDFVIKDLETMINQKFFINAYIDKNTNQIVLQKKPTSVQYNTVETKIEEKTIAHKVVTCKNCGASNNIIIGTAAECEFCGSALS